MKHINTKKMVTVIIESNGEFKVTDMDLTTSTIEQIVQKPMTFSYYYELSDKITVLAALTPENSEENIHYFTLLKHNEPVNFTIDELEQILTQHNEKIPKNV